MVGLRLVEDLRMPAIAAAARTYGLDIAVHLEPYAGRTPDSTLHDIRHLQALGATDFYLYYRDALRPNGATPSPSSQEHGFPADQPARVRRRRRLHAIYTYDIVTHSGDRFSRICQQARKAQLLWRPLSARATTHDGRSATVA